MSIIRNRKIADMFKEAGLIEKYGTGIRRILQGFAAYELPRPKFEEIGGVFRVSVYRGEARAVAGEHTPQVAPHDTPHDTPQVSPEVERLLGVCLAPKSRAELQQALGLSDLKHFGTTYLKPSIEAGLVERTSPDKPHSRLQKYRLTTMGRRVLERARDHQV